MVATTPVHQDRFIPAVRFLVSKLCTTRFGVRQIVHRVTFLFRVSKSASETRSETRPLILVRSIPE